MSSLVRSLCSGRALRLALSVALAVPAATHAELAAAKTAAGNDLTRDVRALARQRPWQCAGSPAAAMEIAGWKVDSDQCAWQNRLRVRHLIVAADEGGMRCVSDQARLWSWARALPGAGTASLPAWHSGWQSNSIHVRNGDEERMIILERSADGQWGASDWRWRPSPRAATRRWQASRWALLVERAAQLRAPQPAPLQMPEARKLNAVIEQTLAPHSAELAGEVWRWKSGGLCLRADLGGMGPPQLKLPYAVDDSRLEQRAAMQLHLARRFPKAAWQTPFTLMPQQPQRRGGAKFYAIWTEEGLLKGQLWMPTKGEGGLVRVRIDTPLPPAGQSAHAIGVIERTLAAMAARWVQLHE